MKVLITGASGFIGSHLTRFFVQRSSVVASYFNSPIAVDSIGSVDVVRLDIRDSQAVEIEFAKHRPDLVIHAAGCKNVKVCQQHPRAADLVNAIGTYNVARACRQMGAKLIYISSDLVFSGQDGRYRETDLPQSNLVYGQTKLWGEKLAQQELTNVAICRSGGVYAKDSPLLRWLSTQLAEKEMVDCFTDVFNTPTYIENLAEAIEQIVQRDLSGIFHFIFSAVGANY